MEIIFFKLKFDKKSLVRKSLLLHHGSETYGTALVHPYSWRPSEGGSHIHQGLSNNIKSTPLILLNFQILIFVDSLIMEILNNSCIASLNITTHPFSQSLGFGRSQCEKPPKTDKLPSLIVGSGFDTHHYKKIFNPKALYNEINYVCLCEAYITFPLYQPPFPLEIHVIITFSIVLCFCEL